MAVIAMFAGVIFFSLTVGSLTSLLSDLDKKNSSYDNKMNVLDNIVTRFGITDPRLLQKVCLAIKAKVYASEDDFNKLLDFLPKKYSSKLAMILYKEWVDKIKIFQNMDPEVILSIAPHLHVTRFSRSETIVSAGEHANEVYFIKCGSVGLVLPQFNEVFVEIREGQYFGETEIVLGTPRNFTVVARSAVELLALEKKHFVRVFFQEFKELGKQLKVAAEKRLIKHLKCYDILFGILEKYHGSHPTKHPRHPQNPMSPKIKEQIMNEYMPFLNLDTFTETTLNFSPSFLERNRDYVPVSSKRVAEDILLENVPPAHAERQAAQAHEADRQQVRPRRRDAQEGSLHDA